MFLYYHPMSFRPPHTHLTFTYNHLILISSILWSSHGYLHSLRGLSVSNSLHVTCNNLLTRYCPTHAHLTFICYHPRVILCTIWSSHVIPIVTSVSVRPPPAHPTFACNHQCYCPSYGHPTFTFFHLSLILSISWSCHVYLKSSQSRIAHLMSYRPSTGYPMSTCNHLSLISSIQ